MNGRLDNTEACVIGSGPGGSTIAKELGEKGVRTVVLEAGSRFNPLVDYTSHLEDWENAGRDFVRERMSLPQMDRVTGPHTAQPNVAYGVGGSALRYLAYSVRMEAHDFKTKTLDNVGMDWPINYEELVPYYRKVENELRISGQAENPWSIPLDPLPLPAFPYSYANKIIKRGCDKLGINLWPVPVARLSRPADGRPMCIQCGNCSNGCMTRAKSTPDVTYIPKAEATGKVTVLPNCVVTRIKVDASGRAKGVVYFDKDGVEREQKAEIIVLSAGAIQSPRILLNSTSNMFPNGLANSGGAVGKYFMQHLSIHTYALFPDRIDSYRGFYGGAISLDYVKHKPSNSYVRGWALELSGGIKGPVAMASVTDSWGSSHKTLMRKTFGRIAGMSAVGEMLPDPRNRIELDPSEKDAYGMPLPRMTVIPRDNDKIMLKAMRAKITQIYEAAGALRILGVDHEPGSGGHNAGSCRMGKDPSKSVLNGYCQTHDVPNLFVVDASTFTTIGTANPSLTIHALACRVAEYIDKLGKSGLS
jgi:choline dehydrogenase-like flavoprotein